MTTIVFSFLGADFTGFGLGCALALLVHFLVLAIAVRRKADASAVLVTALLSVPLCWFFSRLVFVAVDLFGSLFDGSIYLNAYANAALALRFWDGGYSLMGALFGLLAALRLAEGITRTEDAFLRDGAALSLPLALAVERLAEYGTGLGEGRQVSAQWLISTGLCLERDGEFFFPVCLLEAAVALALFAWMLLRRLRGADSKPGDALRTMLTLFGLTQVLLESLRGDDHMVVHFVRAQQVMAILIVVVCMAVWSVRMRGDWRMEGLCWLLTLVCIGLAVLAEFGVDRWDSALLAYGLLCCCLLAIGWAAFRLRDWSSLSA